MVTALNIANNFLELAFKENISISPMKMQKLLYILFKEYLKNTGKILFNERFEAWEYGPVLPNVYSEFKSYRGNPIKNYSLDANGGITKIKIYPGTDFYFIFNDVWKKYKNFSGVELSEFTHRENTAWSKSIENKTYFLDNVDIYEEASYV